MAAPSFILALPVELVTKIFSLASSLRDLHALTASCKQLHSIFIANEPHRQYDAILRRTLPAFDDALRMQRASVGAFQHMIDLGFAAEDFEPLLPPADAAKVMKFPLCHFNPKLKRYENVPTEKFIIELEESIMSHTWEAERILVVHQLVATTLSLAQLPNEDWLRAKWLDSDRMSNISGIVLKWTPQQEERYFRGAYRLWLFGYLFSPGCLWEPVITERQNSEKWSTMEDFLRDRQGTVYPECMLKYPIYGQQMNDRSRLSHVTRLFGGFTDWLVHDGQRRGEQEEREGRMDSFYRVYPKQSDVRAYMPRDHGGKRELLLIHTMHSFFIAYKLRRYRDELDSQRPREPTITITFDCSNFNTGITKWGSCSSTFTTREVTQPINLVASPSSLLPPGGGPRYILSDGMIGLEFLNLALCKHYQLEIHCDLDSWGINEVQDDYQQFGGAVLDQGINRFLLRNGEGGLNSVYGRELLEMWKQGVFEGDQEAATGQV